MPRRLPLRWQLHVAGTMRPVPGWAVRLRNTRISYSRRPGNDAIRFAYRPTTAR